MKLPKYLSPTSLSTFEASSLEFYLSYLAGDRPEKIPQNHHMAIGSSFDAYVKSYLHGKLVGADPRFEFDTLFEAQVEPQNRDKAREDGKYAFACYVKSGALADLMLELNGSIGKPTFEASILGVVNGYREGVTLDLDVPLFGKPDIRFIHREGASIQYDWKVNGFYGKLNTSPVARYKKIMDGWTENQSRSHGTSHKEFFPLKYKGLVISYHYLEEANKKWADQLATYGWLLGETVGTEFICGIDQLACDGSYPPPKIRVAQHRCRISTDYQFNLLERYQNLWQLIQESQPGGRNPGWFFRDLTHEESAAKCENLDHTGLTIREGMSEQEKGIIRMLRGM